MGHMVGKDVYRKLGRKIDGLTMRVPWNDTLHSILKTLYSVEEADFIVSLPYGPARLEDIERSTRRPRAEWQHLLDGLCEKGLVMDIAMPGGCRYMIAPLVIGIFEFTMMRTGENLDTTKWAHLFHSYLQDPSTFYAANFGRGERISPLRALPHEQAIGNGDFVEVLDYEKASAIVDSAETFCIGICSCRHEKLHTDTKECDVPLDTCSSFGAAAEYLIRHNLGRAVSRSEMRENLARSEELGLVLTTDNVKDGISFICHCCGCCCNVLLGVSKFGYPNAIVTSSFIAAIDADECSGCGTCVETCPIKVVAADDGGTPAVDRSVCLGCGVCVMSCPTGAMSLKKREQRVLHPETTFERVILQCLERGTLQNQIFPDPQRVTHTFMRALVGGFLRLPPVKRALMSDALRSRFLKTMAHGH